jgi:signal transduction histidine kinase/ActR/RegA family two-component response regulator
MTPTEAEAPFILRDAAADGFVRVNAAFTELFGLESSAVATAPLADWIHPEDRSSLQRAIEAGDGAVRVRHRTRTNDWIGLDWRVSAGPEGPIALGLETSSRTNVESEAPPARAKERPASHEGLAETLEAMVRIVEADNAGMKCSVLLLDAERRHVHVGAGPSLPASYNAKVEGLAIGPTVGSCGTAAFWNVPVIVADIERDPLWRDLREAAVAAGLRACWSHPITASTGEVLGALALYDTQPRGPTEGQLKSLTTAARLVGLAVERGRAEEALRKGEAEARIQSRLLGAVTAVLTSFVDSGDWKAASKELVKAALELTGGEYGFFGVVEEGVLQVVSFEGVVWDDAIGRDFFEESVRRFDERGHIVFSNFDTLFGHVITSGRALISNDPAADERAAKRLHPGHPPLSSFLGSPILHQGQVVAMIGVANRPGGFSEGDQGLAKVLCSAGSVLFDGHARQQREAELEQQLRQAAKMEALGVLAGGIAHDFNNMLAVVLGNTELALLTLGEEDGTRAMLQRVTEATNRATELCNQMLAYAGRGVVSVERIEFRELIEEIGALLTVALSKKAMLEYDMCVEPLYLEADKTQLRQVVMNLITNAAEAIGNDVGRIRVATNARDVGSEEIERASSMAHLEPGPHVQLTVTDDGSGMSPETQARIFDPFFSTKFTGRGLGLAAVKGIVQGHKGSISLTSAVGEGTTFRILLPLADATTDKGGPAAENPSPTALRRVLVVDDEPAVRSITMQTLRHAGFDVIGAADGEEAIRVYRRESATIDCVLLDLSMPKLDGEETFRELRRIRSDACVIINSGFTGYEMLDRFKHAGFADVLQKPVKREVLIAKLHQAINASVPR